MVIKARMQSFFLWSIALYAALQIFYILYLAAINCVAHQDSVKGSAWLLVGPTVLVMVVVDLLMNITLATLLFVDWPRELLVTSRLKRYKAGQDGLRKSVATWVCESFLNPFAPDKKHC